MKKIIFLISLLVVTQTTLAFNQINVNNGRLSYVQDTGTLEADRIFVDSAEFNDDINHALFYVTKNENSIDISSEEHQFTLKDTKDSMFDSVSNIDLYKFDMNYFKSNSLDMKVQDFSVALGDGIQKMPSLDLKCAQTINQFYDHPISLCLDSLEGEVPKFIIDQVSQATFAKAMSSRGESTEIKNIELSIDQNEFKMDFKYKAKIKIRGQAYFDETKSILTIKIKKAKAGGFISIKGKIFDALEDAQFENVTIDDDTIFIQM